MNAEVAPIRCLNLDLRWDCYGNMTSRDPRGPALEIRTRRYDESRIIVEPVGEIDMTTAADLEREIASVLNDGPVTVGIDLSKTTFVDSSGLRAFLISKRAAEAVGARIAFVGVPERIRKLLKITGLDEHFETFASAAELPLPTRED